MLHTKLFGYVDPRHRQLLARCGQCELMWCVVLRECHGASVLGVNLVQLERIMNDGTWGMSTQHRKKIRGGESLATYFITHHDKLGHAGWRATKWYSSCTSSHKLNQFHSLAWLAHPLLDELVGAEP